MVNDSKREACQQRAGRGGYGPESFDQKELTDPKVPSPAMRVRLLRLASFRQAALAFAAAAFTALSCPPNPDSRRVRFVLTRLVPPGLSRSRFPSSSLRRLDSPAACCTAASLPLSSSPCFCRVPSSSSNRLLRLASSRQA